MELFISVVSHGHGAMIAKLDCLGPLSLHFKVIIKNNIHDSDLKKYCKKYPSILLLDESYGLGFGANNNLSYGFASNSFGIGDKDLFLILNPDLYFDPIEAHKLVDFVSGSKFDIFTINLFHDFGMKVSDNSVRKFPTITRLFLKFLGVNSNYYIDKSYISDPTVIDWAAGSFLCFRSDVYASIGGFDERYFMYYEDVDICYRANVCGNKLVYIPSIFGIHLAAFDNRNIFSKHGRWYLLSVLRYLFFYYTGRKFF